MVKKKSNVFWCKRALSPQGYKRGHGRRHRSSLPISSVTQILTQDRKKIQKQRKGLLYKVCFSHH